MGRKYAKRTPVAAYVIKSLLFAETVVFVGGFYMWSRLSRERDYRQYYLQHRPKILEWYYWSMESMSGVSCKSEDYKVWGLQADKAP